MVDNNHVDHPQQINMDYYEYVMYLNRLMMINMKPNNEKIRSNDLFEIIYFS